MTLPLVISVPHAGTEVPDFIDPYVAIGYDEIVRDGDEQADEVYRPLESEVVAFATTGVARAILDLNRAEDDIGGDGVVKSHTCWNVSVYREFPPDDVIERLLNVYHRPYHARLTAAAGSGALLGVDCHTMAEFGPPVGPDEGKRRPAACVSDAGGACPREWFEAMARCLENALGKTVSLNDPFKGGYITRTHGAEMPWLQLELSRGSFIDVHEKRNAVWAALAEWCAIYGE